MNLYCFHDVAPQQEQSDVGVNMQPAPSRLKAAARPKGHAGAPSWPLGQEQGDFLENRLRSMEESLFPAAQSAQEAEAAFQRMVKGFSDTFEGKLRNTVRRQANRRNNSSHRRGEYHFPLFFLPDEFDRQLARHFSYC